MKKYLTIYNLLGLVPSPSPQNFYQDSSVTRVLLIFRAYVTFYLYYHNYYPFSCQWAFRVFLLQPCITVLVLQVVYEQFKYGVSSYLPEYQAYCFARVQKWISK